MSNRKKGFERLSFKAKGHPNVPKRSFGFKMNRRQSKVIVLMNKFKGSMFKARESQTELKHAFGPNMTPCQLKLII